MAAEPLGVCAEGKRFLILTADDGTYLGEPVVVLGAQPELSAARYSWSCPVVRGPMTGTSAVAERAARSISQATATCDGVVPMSWAALTGREMELATARLSGTPGSPCR